MEETVPAVSGVFLLWKKPCRRCREYFLRGRNLASGVGSISTMEETLPTLPGIFLPWKKPANVRKQPGYGCRNPVDIVDNSSGVSENPVDKIADIFGYSENAVDVVDSISEVWEGIFDIVERISGVCGSPVDVVDGIFECAAASSTLSTTFPPRMRLSGGIKNCGWHLCQPQIIMFSPSSVGVEHRVQIVYKSTTVMPAPPNCTCSSLNADTLGTVARYCRMS